MPFTQTQLDALEAAIAAGVLRVAYEDRTVQYHSLQEMLALREMMKDEIAAANGSPNSRYSRAKFSRE